MSHSYAEQVTTTCPHCEEAFTAEVWLIVDIEERPDLRQRIAEGNLHDALCPYCRESIDHFDLPLLLFRPDQEPPLLFSPAQETTREQDEELAGGLLGWLRSQLVDAWQDKWLAEGLQVVPRTLLPEVLSSGLEYVTEEQAQEAALTDLIRQFIGAQTWNDAHRFVREHPQLLEEKAGILMQQMVTAAHQQQDETAARVFEEHRALLQRCLEIGVDEAFAQIMVAASAEEQEPTGPAVNALHESLEALAASGMSIASAEELERALADLEAQDPAAAQRLINEVDSEVNRQMQTLAPLVEQIDRFIQAETWNESYRIVRDDPQLLTEETNATIKNMIDFARAQGAESYVRILQEHRALLQRCRELGTDQAFAEKMGLASLEEMEPVATELGSELPAILHELNQLTRLSDIPRRIELCHKALRLIQREQDEELWASIQDDLGSNLAQMPQGSRAQNLEQAIHHFWQALEVFTRETYPSDWAMTQNNLANTYSNRIRGSRAQNLEQAIHHYQQALEVRTREAFPTDWAMTQNNLAIAYTDRMHGDRAQNIDRAIHHYQQALEVRTREAFPTDWGMTQNNLAIAYRDRISDDHAQNQEKALHHFQQALEVFRRETFPERWATTQNNLGTVYAHRMRSDRAQNLEQAIHHYQQALEVRTREAFPTDWAMTQNNLAIAYTDRMHGDRAQNIDRAIHHYQQALEVRTRAAFPVEWAAIHNSLGQTYADRIRGDRAQNLERAIHHYQRALEVRTREALPTKWATTQNSLGEAYRNRILGHELQNLEQAIHHYQQALEIYTREAFPADWATVQNNLGGVYFARNWVNRAEDLEQAIFYLEQALQVRTREALPEEWAATQNNLAAAYAARIQGDRAQNLEQAIHHYRQALEVRTREKFPEQWAETQNNLAAAYRDRIRGDRSQNLEQAIRHYQQALDVFTLKALPARQLLTQRNLGELFFAKGRWADAQSAYEEAILANRLLLDAAYTESGRRAEVGETGQLFARMAYVLLKQGKPGQALLALEQGKTRLLAEALAFTAADTSILLPLQQEALEAARRRVRALDAEMRLLPDATERRPEPEISADLQQARADLSRLVDEIHAEHPNFMPSGLDLPQLLALIPAGGALVAPLATSQGGAAFVIPHGADTVRDEHVLWLEDLTDSALDTLLRGSEERAGWLMTYMNYQWVQEDALAALEEEAALNREDLDAVQNTIVEAYTQLRATIERLSSRLWTLLISGVHERLQGLDLRPAVPILLMPQGGLGLLPLHAAWRQVNGERRYFLDDYAVTYAPGGYTLGIARRRVEERPNEHSLLAVVNPTADLPYTTAEGDAVVGHFPHHPRRLDEGDATATAIIDEASSCSYLHFSCHGAYHWLDPMHAGLALANGERLTLADVIGRMNLEKARLVFLSACETGITDARRAPDEYLGLPSGFLQAGAPGVVSTLWAVNDLSTAMLVAKFYDEHLYKGREPADALRCAQLWLRDTSDGEKRAFFLEQERGDGWLAPVAAKAFYQALFDTDDDARSFAHPYYWAAFTFSGA